MNTTDNKTRAETIARIIRSTDARNDTIKPNSSSEFDGAVGKNCKVMGDTNVIPLSGAIIQAGRTRGTEIGGIDDVEVPNIWTDDVICSCQNAG